MKINCYFYCILFFFVLCYLYYVVSYPGGGIFKLPMSHRIEIDPEDIHVTFSDVKGVSIKNAFENIYFYNYNKINLIKKCSITVIKSNSIQF